MTQPTEMQRRARERKSAEAGALHVARKLRIGVSCRALLQQEGGLKRYFSTLLPELLEQGKGHDFVLFYDKSKGVGSFPQAEELYTTALHRVLWDYLSVPRMARKAALDVFFSPKGHLPYRLGCPAVITLHDLGYFVPGLEAYPLADRLYQRWALKSSARRAARIVAVSESTRSEVVKYTGGSPDKIRVVYEAIPEWFLAPPPAGTWERLKRRLGVDSGQYIFAPGSISPRKNLPRLVAALGRIAGELPHKLVLTGIASWGNVRLGRAVDAAGLAGRVVLSGAVSDEELVPLYRMDCCCASVSLYEGFGLPILEAMTAGCPVVTSSVSSMPEAAGDAAELVDPTDVEQIAAALKRVLTDEGLRAGLVARGHENLKRFTPREMAHETLAALEAAAETA